MLPCCDSQRTRARSVANQQASCPAPQVYVPCVHVGHGLYVSTQAVTAPCGKGDEAARCKRVHTQTASELGFDRVLGLEWAYRPRRGKGRDPVTGLS